ncbi:MAG TPA: hypothetical protein VGP26_02485 [Actinophytocola sp.]|nr:hypothetical protein [Actinophytocola sp.]
MTPGPTRSPRGTIAPRAGQRYAIRVAQTEQGGEASTKLIWPSPDIGQQVVAATRRYPA